MNAKAYSKHLAVGFLTGLKWILFGLLSGGIIGCVGAVFARLIQLATAFRLAHPYLLFFLPVGGLAIVGFYRLLGVRSPRGTNLVLSSLRESDPIPAKMAPLIIVSTVLTHLFGGSAGREGAALQVGGSLGALLGRILPMKKQDHRTILICGMAAAFSALFGTPIAAAVFAMEVSMVGVLYYSALIPAVISSLTAHGVAEALGVHGEQYSITALPDFQLRTAFLVLLFGMLASVVSVLFVTLLHQSKHLLQKRFANAYLRVFVSGLAIIALSLLVGDQTYNGTGAGIIEACFTDPAPALPWFAFLLKMVFTAITLGGGFQGGEIVPSLFIGATLGQVVGLLLGISPGFLSALGMCGIFCGVTNCPLASLLISFELFGFQGAYYFLLMVAVTYFFSGNYGLYSSQKILHSKIDHSRVERFTH